MSRIALKFARNEVFCDNTTAATINNYDVFNLCTCIKFY